MKVEFDERKNAKEPSFRIGDLVWYKHPREKVFRKKEPKRDLVPCEVMGIKGSMITVKQEETVFTRNSSFFKLHVKRQYTRPEEIPLAKGILKPNFPQIVEITEPRRSARASIPTSRYQDK